MATVEGAAPLAAPLAAFTDGSEGRRWHSGPGLQPWILLEVHLSFTSREVSFMVYRPFPFPGNYVAFNRLRTIGGN